MRLILRMSLLFYYVIYLNGSGEKEMVTYGLTVNGMASDAKKTNFSIQK